MHVDCLDSNEMCIILFFSSDSFESVLKGLVYSMCILQVFFVEKTLTLNKFEVQISLTHFLSLFVSALSGLFLYIS